MAKNGTIEVTITAETWPFQRAMAKAWQTTWKMEIRRRPIVGRMRYGWALLRHPQMRRALARTRREDA